MENNYKEVGNAEVENPSNAIHQEGACVPEATMGAGEYNFAKSTGLDPKMTAGIVGEPSMSEGYNQPFDTSTVASNIAGPQGRVETTASTENLSRKYKYPQVSEDVPEKGRNQYEDHS